MASTVGIKGRAVMDFIRHKVPIFSGVKGLKYGNMAFWDTNYKSAPDHDHEWGCDPEDLVSYDYRVNGMSKAGSLKTTVPRDQPVLTIGAGSSRLGDVIYGLGIKPVIQCDFSEIVVNRRKVRINPTQPDMFWEYTDCRLKMTHLTKHLNDNQLFGSVWDKGLIDGLYLAGGEALDDISKIVSNVSEVLSDEGVFVTLSRSHPQYITPLLQHDGFSMIEVRLVEKPADIYLYRLCKQKQPKIREKMS
jgi:hypothetical protein